MAPGPGSGSGWGWGSGSGWRPDSGSGSGLGGQSARARWQGGVGRAREERTIHRMPRYLRTSCAFSAHTTTPYVPTAAQPPTVHAVERIVCRQKSARLRLLSAEVSAVCSVSFGFRRSANKSPPPTFGIMCSGGSEVRTTASRCLGGAAAQPPKAAMRHLKAAIGQVARGIKTDDTQSVDHKFTLGIGGSLPRL